MKIPPDLIKQIKEGNCVAFVGAGLSQGSGLPGWSDLLKQMLDYIEQARDKQSDRSDLEKYIERGELLTVASVLRDRLGKNDFHEFMLEVFLKPDPRPTEAHNYLASIPFVAALTSNYDMLLEFAYQNALGTANFEVFTHTNIAALSSAPRNRDFYLFKLHGTINNIETVIIGQNEYRNLIHGNSAYETCLKAIFTTKTVFFVGFGLDDPDLNTLLDQLAATFKGYGGKHYALMPASAVPGFEKDRFDKDYNIHIIRYNDEKDHSEVTVFLKELSEACISKKPEREEQSPPDHQKAKLSNVPELPAHLLERPEHLGAVRDILLADIDKVVLTGKALRVGVYGMGGIGKSVLAAMVARDNNVRFHFPDGVIWVTIGQNPPSITPRQRQIALALDEEPDPFEDVQQGRTYLSKLLVDKECLIILDDVWEVQHAEAFNALGPSSRMLITTRDGGLVDSLDAEECRIDVLTDEAALCLISKWCGADVDSLPPEAGQVTKECGNLPLALALCGAMVRASTPWADLLDALKTADLGFIEDKLPNYEHTNLLKSLKVSIDVLSAKDSKQAKRYCLLAIFPADIDVPEAAIVTLWQHTGLSGRSARRLITLLEQKALLRLDGKTPNRLISLHDLQYDYLQAVADDLPRCHATLLDSYKEKCTDGWHTGPNDSYFFQHLPYHLAQAGGWEELKKLLMDFRWLEAKLDAIDPNALIDDYNVLDDEGNTIREDEFPNEHIDRGYLKLVQGAIRLSAHILARDKGQLATQLAGRLVSHESTGIKHMLNEIRQDKTTPWLSPTATSFTQAGGALIRTLKGHTLPVNSVALMPDTDYIISGSDDNTLKVWDLRTYSEIRTLKGHTDSVNSIA